MAERTLILLRHAKSDWSGDEADIDRPLNGRGRHQAPRAGKWLARSIPVIDLAVVSPANRARSTWELVSAELDAVPPTQVDDRAYAASAGQLLGVLRDLPDHAGIVVLVGHNPGIENLASLLTGESVPMPTSAIAVIGLAGPWTDAGRFPAVLRASGRPPAE
ncbi:SixA phosphatase family protein [Cryobacterium fucosi]|uniref:Histidine phosphatase family protein n=1 Tax=Cryobacterium fucosi TaxID=1259157 RepID=A0A4R9B1S5_9MICO|nr:histidine phosphatase family protein [Cryobacterium fucosi]TFD73970.1 histidine phosphatase family protein [Cryobacterium fucosi]